jgi:hypothetical protein
MLESSAPLVAVIDAYREATKVSDTRVSSRVFGDGRMVTRLRTGSSITVERYAKAMRWFSANWPINAKWPKGVRRPTLEQAA